MKKYKITVNHTAEKSEIEKERIANAVANIIDEHRKKTKDAPQGN